MQFNLVSDQEQVVQFVRRGVSVRVLRGVPEACFIGMWGACPGRFRAALAVSGSFAY